jgi:phosphatidate cytidylyltransferase
MRSGDATGGLAALAIEGAVLKGRGRREIVIRVATALIIAPLGLWAVYSGGITLMLATAACGIVAAFEWTRMAAQTEVGWVRWAQYAALGLGAAGAVFAAPHGLEAVALASLLGCAAACGLAVAGKGSMSSMAFGAIYTSLPFGCFIWIRELAPQGQWLLLAVLVIVWTTDIGAYFAGRGFGGPLLSPKDSPNKTWTGAIGALVCAGLAGAAVARAGGGDFAHWLVFGLTLSIVSQLGDLLESRFKRLYGVKDTSGFVPGHGGVLDRLDGLMAATVAAALIARFLPALAPSLSLAGPQ